MQVNTKSEYIIRVHILNALQHVHNYYPACVSIATINNYDCLLLMNHAEGYAPWCFHYMIAMYLMGIIMYYVLWTNPSQLLRYVYYQYNNVLHQL